MQSAAGGTSQRLKPAFAIVCSRSRIPNPAPDMVPALPIDVIHSSPAAALFGRACRAPSCCLQPFTAPASTLLLRTIFDMRQDRDAHSRILTPDAARLSLLPLPAFEKLPAQTARAPRRE